MPRLSGRLSVSLAVLAVLGMVACSGDSPFPASPTSFASQSGANAQGVTLSGTVLGFGSASLGVTAHSNASDPDVITVTVEGTDISTTVGADGTFTLRGLPEGDFTLVFTDADGVEIGRLDFAEVLPNQEITITVDVSGGSVTLLDERRNGIGHGDIEIQGDIEAALGVDSDGDTRFVINGYTVVARPGVTAIRQGNQRLTVDDLEVGDQVHVKGEWLPLDDGADPDTQEVLAHEIKLQQEDGDDTDDGEAKMTICHKGKNTLVISRSAWPAHRDHGDTEGPC